VPIHKIDQSASFSLLIGAPVLLGILWLLSDEAIRLLPDTS
jgi:hypothetical protein